MITRKHLRLDQAIRYSWKNILYSTVCWALAYATVRYGLLPRVEIPIAVVAILGTALAIILGFRNSSAYERWWEARIIWGGVVNDSRTIARQLLTFIDRSRLTQETGARLHAMVRTQLAWVNALKLQLREKKSQEMWRSEVEHYLPAPIKTAVMSSTNKATRIILEQGHSIRTLHAEGFVDNILFAQWDATLTRLTELQGRAERIKNTPLPRPYDYYTLAFLNIFILFFPFGVIDRFDLDIMPELLLPVTIIVGWIFYQIYVFGKVLSHPFQNWRTDVPLDAISRTIEIDLKEMLGETDIPAPAQPVDGVLM